MKECNELLIDISIKQSKNTAHPNVKKTFEQRLFSRENRVNLLADWHENKIRELILNSGYNARYRGPVFEQIRIADIYSASLIDI